MKTLIKRLLQYRPLEATGPVRAVLAENRRAGRPYVPDQEGDLIYSLIGESGAERCLETGFGTGSTAVHMLFATKDRGGQVTSIDWSPDNFNNIGRETLERSGMTERHRLVEKNSNQAVPELYLAGEKFDFIFIDGWKTFDHLAFELYMMDAMLPVGGCIVFDDSQLLGVRQSIGLLTKHYGYEEVDYGKYNEDWRLRLFTILTTRSLNRPYRAVRKLQATEAQERTRDWHFAAGL